MTSAVCTPLGLKSSKNEFNAGVSTTGQCRAVLRFRAYDTIGWSKPDQTKFPGRETPPPSYWPAPARVRPGYAAFHRHQAESPQGRLCPVPKRGASMRWYRRAQGVPIVGEGQSRHEQEKQDRSEHVKSSLQCGYDRGVYSAGESARISSSRAFAVDARDEVKPETRA